MRIDYLASGSSDCPLLRISKFNESELQSMIAAADALASGHREFVTVEEFAPNGLERNIRMELSIGSEERGVSLSNNGSFRWSRTSEGWREVRDLLCPPLEERNGFQWFERHGHINVLISYDGTW